MSNITDLTTVDLNDLSLNDDDATMTATDAIDTPSTDDAPLVDAPASDDVTTPSPRSLRLALNHDAISHDDFATRCVKTPTIPYFRRLRKHYKTNTIKLAHDATLTRVDVRENNRLIAKTCTIRFTNDTDVKPLDTHDLPNVRITSPQHTVTADNASLTCADVLPLHLAFVAVIARALRPYHALSSLSVTTMNKYADPDIDTVLIIPYNISLACLTYRTCRYLMPCDLTALITAQSILSAYFPKHDPICELDVSPAMISVNTLKYPLSLAVK